MAPKRMLPLLQVGHATKQQQHCAFLADVVPASLVGVGNQLVLCAAVDVV
jgi:hypothetical protein